jgi:4a-hydroxytetrahydrobiopterin dehydratase
MPYSRSSFERVGHAVGEAYVAQHQHVEQGLIEGYAVAHGAAAACVMLRGLCMTVHKLRQEEVNARLHELPEWALREEKLHREYEFDGFAEAFGFMSTCALLAQKQDHHPEWFNVFNRVVVDLTTHDAGGISALDFALAGEMERAASAFPRADSMRRRP